MTSQSSNNVTNTLFENSNKVYSNDGSYKYSLVDNKQYFINECIKLHKIGEAAKRATEIWYKLEFNKSDLRSYPFLF